MTTCYNFSVLLFSLQGLLRTAEQLKIKGLCETTDQLEESAPETALITVPLSESEEAQQSQSNINASSAICTVTQQTSNTSIKKSRVRKRSKSPDINAHNNETNQQAYSSSSTVGFNSPISVVSTLSPIGTAPVGTVSSVDIHPTQQHHHNTHQQQQTQNLHQQPNLSGTSVNNRSHDSSSPSVKPTKIIKTEDISNNDVNSNAQTSGTILTQIVVSRDKDSKTMASLGMGIVSTFFQSFYANVYNNLFSERWFIGRAYGVFRLCTRTASSICNTCYRTG